MASALLSPNQHRSFSRTNLKLTTTPIYCRFGWATATSILLLALGCDTDVIKNSDHAELQRAAGSTTTVEIENSPLIPLRSGYSIPPLHAKSTWKLAGTIPQGRLLKSVDHVLMVDAGHKYEGYLVVEKDKAVGVYLPVEAAFVAARTPVTISFKENSP